VQTPLEISFHNLDFSAAVETKVQTRILRLEKLFGRITSCHVHIEAPHQRRGNRFEVRIETRVPGAELAVSNDPGDSDSHGDIYVAIRDAFNAMERQLKRWKRQVRGEGKHYPETAQP
jgi:ribosomal subunit interface protein